MQSNRLFPGRRHGLFIDSFPLAVLITLYLFPIDEIAVCQPVTIQTEPAPVEYYRIPDYPLPANYTTYSADIVVNFSDLSKTGYTESNLIDTYLNLDGYKRISKSGDVEITVNIGEMIIWSEARTTSKTKTKDSQGKEITRIKYHIELKYSMPMSVEIFNKEGKTLLDNYVFTMSDTRTWFSPYYDNISDLESYWRIQRTTRLNDSQRDLTKEGLGKVQDMINNNFGYRLIKDKVRFATIGKKKHEDYDLFQKNVEIMQSAFELMKADKGLEAVKTKAGPALAFYQERADKYKTSNRDEKRLKHICIYNQALAYFWLEDFDQSEVLAKSIQRFDSKNKDVRRLLEDIEYTRSSLQNANRTTRHQIVIGGKT